MTYFKKNFKYNIQEKLMYYREKLNSLNTLIKLVTKLNNKLYKLAIEISYRDINN